MNNGITNQGGDVFLILGVMIGDLNGTFRSHIEVTDFRDESRIQGSEFSEPKVHDRGLSRQFSIFGWNLQGNGLLKVSYLLGELSQVVLESEVFIP
jgi:hypothetical protein